jgi:hypothetical protein
MSRWEMVEFLLRVGSVVYDLIDSWICYFLVSVHIFDRQLIDTLK